MKGDFLLLADVHRIPASDITLPELFSSAGDSCVQNHLKTPKTLSERGNKSDHIKMICKHQTLKACLALGQALPFVCRLSEMMQESFCLDSTMNMHLVRALLMTSHYKFCWISNFSLHISNTARTGKVFKKRIIVCQG